MFNVLALSVIDQKTASNFECSIVVVQSKKGAFEIWRSDEKSFLSNPFGPCFIFWIDLHYHTLGNFCARFLTCKDKRQTRSNKKCLQYWPNISFTILNRIVGFLNRAQAQRVLILYFCFFFKDNKAHYVHDKDFFSFCRTFWKFIWYFKDLSAIFDTIWVKDGRLLFSQIGQRRASLLWSTDVNNKCTTKLWSAKKQIRQCLAIVLIGQCVRLCSRAQHFDCTIEEKREKLISRPFYFKFQ